MRLARFLFPLLTLSGSAVAENDELWDDYTSTVQFEQFNGTLSLSPTTQSWFSFGGLPGFLIEVTVLDSTSSVTFEPPMAGTVVQQADAVWQWDPIHVDSVFSGNCQFEYALDLGSLVLPFTEGYQLAQRETLAWSGPANACPDRVRWYLDQARLEPVMPLHFATWQQLASPAPPADTGRIEALLIHDLRRTRLLLPLEDTAEVDADPWNGALPNPGDGPSRFALIADRLAPLLFASGFEGP